MIKSVQTQQGYKLWSTEYSCGDGGPVAFLEGGKLKMSWKHKGLYEVEAFSSIITAEERFDVWVAVNAN